MRLESSNPLKLLTLGCALLLVTIWADAQVPEYIVKAVSSESRSGIDRARDAGRKPAEVLELSGIKPGDKVVELAGIGQYYTTLLSEIVGDDGAVDVYDPPFTEGFAGEASRKFAAAHANTTYHQVDYNDTEFPAGVDVIFNILFYHELQPHNIDTGALNKKLLAALKPGGLFVVIDHKAQDSSGWRDATTIHRMDTGVIKQEVTAAGFELLEESDLLSHPEDDRTRLIFGPAIRGKTDRAVFVFRKPD